MVKEEPKLEKKATVTAKATVQKDSNAELNGKDLPKQAQAKDNVKKEKAAAEQKSSADSARCIEVIERSCCYFQHLVAIVNLS